MQRRLTERLFHCCRFLKKGCDPGGDIRYFHSGLKLGSENSLLKSWINSIVQKSSSTDRADSFPKETVVKRPPVQQSIQFARDNQVQKNNRSSYIGSSNATSNTSKAFSNSRPKVKLRRNLSDNMWTSEPMDDKIIWVDCEMTGLDPETDKLMEIGIIITDANLNVIAQHDSMVFQIDEVTLNGMGEWCQKHHGDSGLIDAARTSSMTYETADEILLKFLQAHTKPGECPMAGNSIGQDRKFIVRQLPKFYKHFHYRSIDVSTIKELVRRWYPDVAECVPKKKFSHRVLDDIMDSITELQFYRSTAFAPPDLARARALQQKDKKKATA